MFIHFPPKSGDHLYLGIDLPRNDDFINKTGTRPGRMWKLTPLWVGIDSQGGFFSAPNSLGKNMEEARIHSPFFRRWTTVEAVVITVYTMENGPFIC
jgi:hypothetical protein